VLLVCIGSYLKSVLRYKFVIFEYLSSGQSVVRCEDPWLFFEAPQKKVRQQKKFGKP